jgi:hypothetical protein
LYEKKMKKAVGDKEDNILRVTASKMWIGEEGGGEWK